MKVGDLVRCEQQYQEQPKLGVFLGYQDVALGVNKMRSHVFVEGEKFLFLTRELEAVR